MTVGYHSPLPPALTGVADYAESLLMALKKHGQIEINAPAARINLYQIGNNQLHAQIYQKALARPGVVILHDAVLQHFFLGSLTQEQYIEEFVYNYGEWTRGQAKILWDGRAGSAANAEYFRYPMLKRIAETSLAIIAHNPAAAAIVKAHCASANVIEIPHLFEAPVLRSERRAPFLFGIFGHLRESKRVLPLLRAYRDVRKVNPNVGLLVAGPCASSDLARAMNPLLNQPGIVRVGHTTTAGFWTNAQSVNACVNLRHPAAGETSGIAIRLMGIGKPVVVTGGMESARFPETACLRVDAGPAEQEMLTAFMIWLSRSPGHAREIGQQAADHIHRHHSLETVAAQFWETLLQTAA